MTPTDELIRRLEAATGPDRELDRSIEVLVVGGLRAVIPPYTGSIDAALPGEDIVTMYKIPDGYRCEHCEINADGSFDYYSADGKTEALARRIAALRARAATERTEA